MAKVEFKNIKKSFGDVEVVKEFDFTVEDGEFVVFLGPSGCGKSTTLRMLAGLESISSGDIVVGGKVMNKVDAKDRDLAMVFQSYALYPHMTVYENIAFALKLKGMPKAEIDVEVRKAAKMLELDPLLNRKPKELSGGQRQRVAMGRAMVRTPKVFLFDEPLSNLDAKLRGVMREEIKHLHRELKTTTIYVTHDQIEAMTLADRIVILKDGYVAQVGTPTEVFQRPANKFVAQFIGENNRLTGTVKSVSKGVASVTLDSGDDVKALAINTGGAGERTLLSIRPERCIVTDKKTRGMSALHGRIEELIYLGDHIRCRMNVAGDDQFVVKVPNTSDKLGLNIGAEVYVGWDTSDCRALDYPQ